MIPNIKMTYNGKNPEDFGVCVTAVTTRKPARKYYAFDIPGRNGVHKEMLRVWDNTTVDVSFAILGESSGDVIDKCDTMMEWLTEPNGYARLELSTDPDVYRMATVSEDFEISDVLAKTGEATVSFDCKPQRYLKAGERVALTVEGTSASSLLVAEGLAGDICSSAFKTAYGPAFSRIENMRITVIDGQYLITGSSALRLYYPETGGTMLFGYGDDPTSVSYSQGVQLGGPIFKKELVLAKQGGDYTITPQSGHSYILFTTPARWEMFGVLDGTIGDSAYPDSDTIVNPTRFDASPTLHITLPASHIMTDKGVLCINDEAVRMTFDSNNIVVGQYSKPMTDLYIDCETMNAYTFSDGGIFNLNANVTLPDGQILLQPGENTVYTNGAVESIEIIPNWWRL